MLNSILCPQTLSRVRPLVWAVAWQASLSMGFSRQEHWTELSFPATKKKGEEAIKEF